MKSIRETIALTMERGMIEMPFVLHNLLGSAKTAKFLGISRAVWRKWSAQELTPRPITEGIGKDRPLWHRKELVDWLDAGCPTREKWDMQKNMERLRGERHG